VKMKPNLYENYSMYCWISFALTFCDEKINTTALFRQLQRKTTLKTHLLKRHSITY